MDLYPVFIDLTNYLGAVSREALWVFPTKLGCCQKFIQIIWFFHDGMMDIILSNGDIFTLFDITNGVKGGCVLAAVFFNIFFTYVLNHALMIPSMECT